MTVELSEEDIARRIQLERSDAAQKAVAEAVKRIENLGGNEVYRKAWKAAIKAISAMRAE